jgi:hypothetical protein
MKTCSMCGQTKPLEAFHRGKSPDGRQVWCKPCRKAYDHAYFAATKPLRVAQKRARKAELVAWVRSLKEQPCADCGGTFHPVAMHFDHRPDEDKVLEIAFMIRGYSRKRILAEIAKCDLVCANCHAVRTFERQNGA